jgi:hypothetical protein
MASRFDKIFHRAVPQNRFPTPAASSLWPPRGSYRRHGKNGRATAGLSVSTAMAARLI